MEPPFAVGDTVQHIRALGRLGEVGVIEWSPFERRFGVVVYWRNGASGCYRASELRLVPDGAPSDMRPAA